MGATLRPVVDPSLPHADRGMLESAVGELTPAGAPPPAAPRWGGRTRGDAVAAVQLATLCGFLPVVGASFLLGRVGLALGAIAQAGLLSVWWWGGLGYFLLAGTVLQAASWVLIFILGCGEDEKAELARRHHGRYYVDADFGTSRLRPFVGVSLLAQMQRAQASITTVVESEVNAAGLLDDTANAVTLPQQEWEIAQALAELTRVATQVQMTLGDGKPSPQVTEVLEPQRQALKTSADALVLRVNALERYAQYAQSADEAYREWRRVQELEELTDDTRDILARTVRDELAVAEIDELAERSGLLQLRRTVGEARQAGQGLALPTAERA
ncbi:hypothetical protein Pth03_58620 [Planotetraspora thailandica]|uniref:Uncharacterized protein n=1 Tax=Planotetraspora thailandica TaxID=487172 RepID=A0A8J3V695_9ACTN|nr:hypothetical protein Pth03_58620 [Planotetraspora thailandica]